MPIEVLDQATINRIAAGEVIIRPVHAIKELLENSIDANATMIQVDVLEGGLKLIRVKDDGTGININDLPMLCHRYATSKLTHFDDMTHLTTFGFRGEALASISDITFVTVYTRTEDSSVGFEATFKQGNMLNKPTLCATVKGTSILIQDLFQNTPIRLKSMKSSSEYNKIVDCIEKYAIHYYETSFILKTSVIQFQVKKASSLIERIQSVYHCQEYQSIQHKNHPQFEFELIFSTQDYNHNTNSNKFILFVNGRLVENKVIKRSIYDTFLKLNKNKNPFLVYLSLKVFDLTQIDVNIHPSKNEVTLLNQDIFIDIICHALTDKLVDSIPIQTTNKKQKTGELPKMKTLDAYFNIKPTAAKKKEKDVSIVPQLKNKKKNKTAKKDMSSIIQQLQQQVLEVKDKDITILFEEQKYLAFIHPLLVLSKYQGTFYLLHINMISEELFYQLTLKQFGHYGHLMLNPPLSIKQCSALMHVQDITPLLVKYQVVLGYFHIGIKGDLLTSLPMIIADYIPTLDKLPLFLYRLVATVDYLNDIQCFQDICRELGQLYSCTTLSQYKMIHALLCQLKAPCYIVEDGYLVEFDIPLNSL